MTEPSSLEKYKVLVDNALIDYPLYIRQNKVAVILSEAQKHFPKNDFRELQDYVFERLEK